MPLSADTLLDRLYLKQQISRWRLVAIVAIIGIGLIAVERGSGHSPIERSYIARLTLEGVIYDDRARDEVLEDIRDNRNIKGLIVRLETPGGSTVGGMQTYRLLREIAKEKPVVAVMRDLSASAGYLIALGADRSFASEGTLTGSIGVIVQTAEFTTLAEKIGITPITVKTGPYKDILSPYSKASPESLETIQKVVNDFYDVFVNLVAERRHLPREEVVKLADGRVFTGRMAVQNRLVDQVGGEDEAIAWMEREKQMLEGLEVRDIKIKKEEEGLLNRLADSVMQKILPNAAGGLDGLVSIWHPSLQIQ